MKRRLLLAALFTPGLLTAASADVVNMDNFNVTLKAPPSLTTPSVQIRCWRADPVRFCRQG
jgi:hypothetical protein